MSREKLTKQYTLCFIEDICNFKYLVRILYAAYVKWPNVRQKLDKTDGGGRSYLYANLNSI
jgi:hypothetical protein